VVVVHQETNLDSSAAEAFAQICAKKFEALGGSGHLALTLVSLSKDGKGRIITDASLRDANGAELRHAQLDAASLEDAPAVCDRLSRALINGVSTEAALNLHNVTQAEAEATADPVRIGTEHLLGVQTRFGVPIASGAQPVAFGAFGFDGRFLREKYFLEVGVGLMLPSTLSSDPPNAIELAGFFGNFGAGYFLSEGDVSAYLGGGLESRLMFQGQHLVAVVPYLDFGVMFFRTSRTKFYVEARAGQNVLATGTTTGQSVYPTELTLMAGIGF
jgi:hypothetical protein